MSKNLREFQEGRRAGNDELLARIRGVQRGRFDDWAEGEDEDEPKEKKTPDVIPLPEKEEDGSDITNPSNPDNPANPTSPLN